jgi:hypothetical protein
MSGMKEWQNENEHVDIVLTIAEVIWLSVK